jgi:hypothetical protein
MIKIEKYPVGIIVRQIVDTNTATLVLTPAEAQELINLLQGDEPQERDAREGGRATYEGFRVVVRITPELQFATAQETLTGDLEDALDGCIVSYTTAPDAPAVEVYRPTGNKPVDRLTVRAEKILKKFVECSRHTGEATYPAEQLQ